MKPRFILAIAAAAGGLAATTLVLAGCAPPYLLALDKAARLTHQMKLIATLGAVSLSDADTNARLLPPKPSSAVTSIDQLNIQSGFLISDNPLGESVVYAYVDSGGQVQTANSLPALSLSGADGHYPLYQYEVTQTTTNAYLVIYRMDPNNASLDTATLVGGGLPPAGSLFTAVAAASLSSFNGNGYPVIGESVVPGVSGGPDSFQWLLSDMNPTTPSFTQISTTLQGTSQVFNNVSPTLIAMPFPPGVARYMYYSQARSYLEYYSGGWVCLDITSNLSPVQLTGITHRIDALLTDGDLLSTEDDTLTLYDPNGSQLLTMPMGGLKFCYEAYVGSTAYCFFSLPMLQRHGNWIFAVYAVPTSQMRGL
ncbi:MAG TPA: hypothetical protein VMF68_12270 [Spirochaetia bacterium]|nr:hypothetical protein [Spirochaetia bacterium]